ncbi:MAG: lipase [Roseburia sp.]|nr:lipase [Roseburia sp.]
MNQWISMWGNAISFAEHRPESYAKNITLRYPIYVPFDGEALRFTFDNFCGNESIDITRATVAVSHVSVTDKIGLTCPMDDKNIYDITFFSSSDVTILPKDHIISDPVFMDLKAGDTICVNIYFRDYTLMRSAVQITGPLSKGFYSVGDTTRSGRLPLDFTKTTNWYYFLSNIEILSSQQNHTILCYGDSITAQSWPDYLMLRAAANKDNHTAIIRRAVSGTRVLRQYDCITYQSYGLKGENRFLHEAPASGCDTIIIQQGINDIIHPVGKELNPFRPMSDLPTSTELIDGLKWYIEEARNLNYKVYLGTLLPFNGWRTYADFREELRNEVNAWIRATKDIDGCIDFDMVLRDEQDPSSFRRGYDSGDHLHPSARAYKAMADAVPSYLIY